MKAIGAGSGNGADTVTNDSLVGGTLEEDLGLDPGRCGAEVGRRAAQR